MFSPVSLSFLFYVSLLISSVSATTKPCASQSVKPPPPNRPSRHSHSSHPSLHVSLHDLIKSRQAVALPPILYKTQKQTEKVTKSLKKLKNLGWELESVRDEMGILSNRVKKHDKRDKIAHESTGQEIHDLLHHLLDYFQSSPSSIASRTIHREEQNPVIKPVENPRNHRASAVPCPSSAPSGRANLQEALSRVVDTFSSTLDLATDSIDKVSSPTQQTSIEALINELRWEMSTLLSDTQLDVPELTLPYSY
ncbi:uncharacterized protein JCM6883_005833 [Sporobolomyces salmoneus]|uniref:uncharacterized protein n=1 Tax=Sporobolomyces salmoneus TaxID=183962 RepID=UPI00316D18A1